METISKTNTFSWKKWKNPKFADVCAKHKRHQTQLLGRIFIKIKRWIQRAHPFWLIPSGKASKWRCEKLCQRIPGRFFAKTKKCWRQHNMGAIMDFLFQFVNINTIYLSAKFGGDWVYQEMQMFNVWFKSVVYHPPVGEGWGHHFFREKNQWYPVGRAVLFSDDPVGGPISCVMSRG